MSGSSGQDNVRPLSVLDGDTPLDKRSALSKRLDANINRALELLDRITEIENGGNPDGAGKNPVY